MKAKVLTSILIFLSLLSASWFANDKYVHQSVEYQTPLIREQPEMLYINSPTPMSTGVRVGQEDITHKRFREFGSREYVRIKDHNPDNPFQDGMENREEEQELWYFE